MRLALDGNVPDHDAGPRNVSNAALVQANVINGRRDHLPGSFLTYLELSKLFKRLPLPGLYHGGRTRSAAPSSVSPRSSRTWRSLKTTQLLDQAGRPQYLLEHRQPIRELVG
jgi:hypothetical protein